MSKYQKYLGGIKMLRKMKPKAFTAEQLQAIQVEATTQTTNVAAPKSTDPVNYPVFELSLIHI